MTPKTATRKRRKAKGSKARIVREREPSKPGPDTARLVIEGDWREAVRKALKKGKPG